MVKKCIVRSKCPIVHLSTIFYSVLVRKYREILGMSIVVVISRYSW